MKLKFAFDFPVGHDDHIQQSVSRLLNKQLTFLDGLERIAEDGEKQAKGEQNYTVNSWLSSLNDPANVGKCVRVQAVTMPLWKAPLNQTKNSFLYSEYGNKYLS